MTTEKQRVLRRRPARPAPEVLPRDECLRLLNQADTARLGWADWDKVRIVPVSIAMAGGAVVFWTGPGRKLGAALAGLRFTLEVEQLEPALQIGWSLEVVGRPTVLSHSEAGPLLGLHRPTPWVGIEDAWLVQVSIDEITGRRLVMRDGRVDYEWCDDSAEE